MTAHAIAPDERAPEARAIHALRNALSAVALATYDGTVPRADMRATIMNAVVPEIDRIAELFERQERTIEEQRVEILRLTRFADRAEARDTRNQQQLIAANDVIRSFGQALDGLVPLLENLTREMHVARLDAHPPSEIAHTSPDVPPLLR